MNDTDTTQTIVSQAQQAVQDAQNALDTAKKKREAVAQAVENIQEEADEKDGNLISSLEKDFDEWAQIVS